jgi:hypothetical protein
VAAVLAILASLIVVTPAFTVIDGPFVRGCVLAYTAALIMMTALVLRPADLARLTHLTRPITALACLPALWMLIQVVPLPGGWLAHSIWESASSALSRPVEATISVDIGATLLSLCWYAMALAAALATTAVALDRQKADVIFSLLTACAAVSAVAMLGLGTIHLQYVIPVERTQVASIAVIGLLLSYATGIRAYQHRTMHGERNKKPEIGTLIPFAASAVSFMVCLAAIATEPNAAVIFASVAGIGTLLSITVIRRLGLGNWGKSGIAAAALICVAGFFAINPANKDVDATLALSAQPPASVAIVERMLTDAKLGGTGAGTFGALWPIYRNTLDVQPRAATTAAASTAIEMGRPFLWTTVILALLAAFALYRRSLLRGREYFYSGTGAGCILSLLILSFANAAIFGLALSLLSAMVCGLALARSKG